MLCPLEMDSAPCETCFFRDVPQIRTQPLSLWASSMSRLRFCLLELAEAGT